MIGMIFQRWMQHPLDALVTFKELQHGKRVGHVALHSHAERLHALQ
jgi:hypothetical protein